MKQRPIVAVVDGQGGGVGRMLVERLRSRLGDRAEILALGTNVHATEQMLRAGADDGATGENAIRYNAPRAQVIVGVAAILAGNALLGELSPDMAAAISCSSAHKVLLPLNRCGIEVVGVQSAPLPVMADQAAEAAARALD
jgi:hypothetical protein